MSSAITSDLNRRIRPRLNAWIKAVGFPGNVPCHIVDISWDGARLHLDGPQPLWGAPILVEWDTGRAYECAISWQDGAEVGVSFVKMCLLNAPVRAQFEEARLAWLNNQAAKRSA